MDDMAEAHRKDYRSMRLRVDAVDALQDLKLDENRTIHGPTLEQVDAVMDALQREAAHIVAVWD